MRTTLMKKIILVLIVCTMVIHSLPGLMASETRSLDAIIVNEGFEAGGMPPVGWTKTSYSSSRTWKIATDQVHSGTKSAMVPIGGSQDEKLISPLIDLTPAYDYAHLSFWCQTYIMSSHDGSVKLYVDTVGDGFQEDEVIWDMVADEDYLEWQDYAWKEKTFDLTPFLGSSIYIQWRYEDDGSDLRSFYLDDITITVPQVTPKTTLAVGKIGYGSQITAEVKNTGEIPAENIEWTIEIEGGMQGGIQSVATGELEKLKRGGHADDTTFIGSGSFFGLGMVDITVTVSSTDADPETVTRTAKGFVILSRCYPMIRLFTNQSIFS